MSWRPWPDGRASGRALDRWKIFLRYAIAIGLAILAMGLRLLLGNLIGTRAPYITFFIATLISAGIGGFGPGLVTTALGTLLADFFVTAGTGLFGLIDPADPGGIVRFLIGGVGVSYICGLLIAAREQAEIAERAERTGRLLIEQTLAGLASAVISTDVNGRIQLLNPAAERLIGSTAADALGLAVESALKLCGLSSAAIVDEVVRSNTVVWLPPDTRLQSRGQPIDIEGSASPVCDETGGITGVVVTLRDVSERKRDEKLLAAQAEELRRSNRELEEFAYVVSHDLQEPLRNVNTFSELLVRRAADGSPGDLDSLAQVIHSSVERMNRLIHDLLGLSRAVHGSPRLSAVDSQRALQQALDVCAPFIAEAGATVNTGDLPPVMAQDTLLAQVFQNLLSNAVKYRRPGHRPVVAVTARRENGAVIFTVADDGIGFDPKYADRVFGLFKRLHTEEYPGTGAGLAITKKIVERFHGSIWAEAEPGRGAKFHFALAGTESPPPES